MILEKLVAKSIIIIIINAPQISFLASPIIIVAVSYYILKLDSYH